MAAIDGGLRVPFTVQSHNGTVAEVETSSHSVINRRLARTDAGSRCMRDAREAVLAERDPTGCTLLPESQP